MNYRIIIKPSAEKDILRLPRPLQNRALAKLGQLAVNPRLPGSIKLTGSPAMRVRVGDWRIVYEVDDKSRTVFVTIVAHRGEAYRR